MVMTGESTTKNEFVAVTVPPCVVTATFTFPEEADAGTIAEIEVALETVNDVAVTPPNFTAVAPRKFVPVIVTIPPRPPAEGAMPLKVGASTTVKPFCKEVVPPAVVTDTSWVPVSTSFGTVTETALELLSEISVAATDPIVIAEMLDRYEPLIVSTSPRGPADWLSDVMIGLSKTLNAPAADAVPPGVITIMSAGPEVTVSGTTAVIVDALTTV